MEQQGLTQTARRGPEKEPPRLQVGELTVTVLDGGRLWLDGGAMFGIIPKPMWLKLTESDEQNRIPLAMTCLLVESGPKRVLVETGSGPAAKYSAKEQGFYRFGGHGILDSLRAADLDPESIDYVITTHLHFDHAGGGTMSDGRGGYVPTFPRARYIVQRGEWEDAVHDHAVMRATYRAENLAPLEDAGVVALVEGEAEIVPGVTVVPMPGHTRHQQGVMLSGGSARAVQPGDLLPTSAHVGIRYNMGYDLLPYENMRNKERLLHDALRGDWRLFLGQDPRETIWRVDSDGRGGFALAAGGA